MALAPGNAARRDFDVGGCRQQREVESAVELCRPCRIERNKAAATGGLNGFVQNLQTIDSKAPGGFGRPSKNRMLFIYLGFLALASKLFFAHFSKKGSQLIEFECLIFKALTLQKIAHPATC